MVESVFCNGTLIALIIRNSFHKEGIEFLTPTNASLQVGYMSHPAGHEIMPHVHNPVRRETLGTHEVLFVKKGKMRVDFFSFEQDYLESKQLSTGDMILLVGAGHGITMLEPTVLVEVKNGPYIQGQDKERFQNPLSENQMVH